MRRNQVKDLQREQQVFNFRAWLAAAFMGAALLLVASRLFWLQVVEYDEYLALSQGNRVKVDPLSPDRGLLL
ncbi:MAG: penicillin-binding protein 2, partial [Steroidobacteraceae bacterium]